jgi:ABC-type antimicrobial peptide transport system permease subunit
MIIRIMLQNKRSTLINFLGLVLGLSSFIVVFSWIRIEFSVDRFHSNKKRLYQLVIQHPDGVLDSNTPYAMAPGMQAAFPELANHCRLVRLSTQQNTSFDFFPEEPEREPVYETKVVEVDTGFFGMFTFETIHSNGPVRLDRPDGVLLSKKLANKHFKEMNPVGRQIKMNGHRLLEITGVIDQPENSQLAYDLYLSTPQGLDESWTWRDPSFVLLKKGVDESEFEAKISSYLNDYYPNHLPDVFIVKLLRIDKANLAFGKKKEFLLFSGIAILLLIIVAINYMNLSTANYTKRIREMGIRKIQGATPTSLRNQLLMETLIQTSAAMICALFLAELLLPSLSNLFNSQIRIGYGENPLLGIGFIGLILLFSFLSFIYPVLVFTRGNPTHILRDTFVKGKSRSNVLLLTTIFQFTVSVSLLICTMVVLRQISFAKNTPPGVDVEEVIKVPLNPQIGQAMLSFFNEIKSHQGVIEVTAGQKNPINEDYKTNIDWPGRDPASFPLVRYSICFSNFPAFFGHEIKYGRLYSDTIAADYNRFLINETACELLGKENPVGDRISMWDQEGEILGVFKDYHHISVHREILPHVVNIRPSNYRHLRYMFIRLRPGNQAQAIKFIDETFRKFAGDFPFTYEYLDDEIKLMYEKDVRLARIIGAFAFLALLISCLGIYGLARYSVEKKARDLTIRRVFGASFRNIIVLANTEMIRRIGISILLAVPLSVFVLEKWLRTFAYRTDLSWWFFLLGSVLGIFITVSATMIGIWRSLNRRSTEVLNQI